MMLCCCVVVCIYIYNCLVKWYNVVEDGDKEMEDDLDKMDRRNDLLNKSFVWGMCLFGAIVAFLLVKMFLSTS